MCGTVNATLPSNLDALGNKSSVSFLLSVLRCSCEEQVKFSYKLSLSRQIRQMILSEKDEIYYLVSFSINNGVVHYLPCFISAPPMLKLAYLKGRPSRRF